MRAVPWIIVCVALMLRAVALLDQSFSLDEGYSAIFSRVPLSSIVLNSGLDANPPLGNSFFHIWCSLVGYSPALMRIPGVLASVCSLVILWKLLRPLLPESSTLFVLLFKAVSLYDIFYARQLRIYPFAEVALLLSWLFLRELLEKPSLRAMVLWAAFSALACHLHYFCFLVVAATCFVVLVGAVNRRIVLIKGILVFTLLAAPLSFPLLQQVLFHRSFGWIAEPGAGTLLVTAYQLCGHSLVVLALSFVLLFSAVVIRNPRTGRTGVQEQWIVAMFCAAMIATVVGLAGCLSFVGGSFFHPRYFFFVQVPFLCLLSIGLCPFSRRAAYGLSCSTVAAALITTCGYLTTAADRPTGAQVMAQAVPSLSRNTLLIHRTKCSFSVGQLYDRFRHQHRLLQGAEESNMFHFPGLAPVFISLEEASADQEAVFVTILEGCSS